MKLNVQQCSDDRQQLFFLNTNIVRHSIFLHSLIFLETAPCNANLSRLPRYFVCATVRVLGAWLAEETLAMREDVCQVLPFVVGVAQDAFQGRRREFGSGQKESACRTTAFVEFS